MDEHLSESPIERTDPPASPDPLEPTESPQPVAQVAPSTPPLGPASPAGPKGPPPSLRKVGLVVGAVALALTSGFGGALGARALDDDDSDVPASITAAPDADASVSETSEELPDEALSQAAAKVLPSVVSITADSSSVSGLGSGVVISEDGLVLTNNHVVAEAETGGELTVTLPDGTTASAEIVGTDPATDLAVIQLQNVDELGTLTPATLGSSADLSVGDTLLAVGSPLGYDGSVSSGIVSALNRAITLSDSSDQFGGGGNSASALAVIDAIQTDAAINPGNSGGPLVNLDGEVVGINTAIASLAQSASSQSGSIGVGFAIPIDAARVVVEQLVEDGEATHAYLGVQLADGVESGSTETGAVIAEVEDGSPAADAGLQSGDLVTAVDGETVRDATGLTAAIRAHAPGDEVTLTVRRDDEETEITATLASLPTDG